MRCDRVKEFLMTDYFDGIAGAETQKAVKEHCSICASCRETEQALTRVRISLQNSSRREPPLKVWENIQSRILEDNLNEQSQSLTGWLKRLFAPKPIFAASTVMAIMLVVVVLNFTALRRQVVIRVNGEEAINLYNNAYQEDSASIDLGTDIEKYFL
jgi:predicted anti-sigma-YlaC factor YlaD